ncbi:MAG: hypothetical protein QG657_3060 [Acidobacteriota bacterium]|nr:hypothetical protein [Acidobacteriota bacterium]
MSGFSLKFQRKRLSAHELTRKNKPLRTRRGAKKKPLTKAFGSPNRRNLLNRNISFVCLRLFPID